VWGLACGGESGDAGTIRTTAVAPEIIAGRASATAEAAAQVAARVGVTAPEKQILFGDLHVHTTFSPDAFVMSLPLMGGEGARPPAMACDYARHCSALDFWSINDHAEGVTPRRWRETVESIRACNATAGDPANPDLVAFPGWEWSQVSWDRERHFGHKNVIFRGPEQVPARAVGAPRERLALSPLGPLARGMLMLRDWEHRDEYWNFSAYYEETAAVPPCAVGVDSRELPTECMETAEDPQALFEKLEQWGFDSVVIPHGTAWGLNTPPGTSYEKQLSVEQHDPARQTLIELYSGHGNSEPYRDWRHVRWEPDGAAVCPVPTEAFLPCCWRAGELIAERCEAAGESAAVCQERAAEARANFVDASVTGYWTVPGSRVEDWLDCGVCRDCFNPPLDLRPQGSAQYALALSRPPAAPEDPPLRFRFGFIGSSDVHRARPGTGYKEFGRRGNTEATGAMDPQVAERQRDGRAPEPRSSRYEHGVTQLGLQLSRPMERQASFFMTGGLVGVHAAGRHRDAIWSALNRREVYATTGDRILLWFDLLHRDGDQPMGVQVSSSSTPRFRVRAVGAFEQRAGCPPQAIEALGADGIEDVCLGECYNPSEERRLITRIEVVRIRPQRDPSEPVGDLIDDPWRIHVCDGDAAGCVFEFEDREFAWEGRDAVYYARAIQEPTLAVNAGGLRCERDADGRCVEPRPCFGGYPTAAEDDCLAPNEERAWSSPIFVDYAQGEAGGADAAVVEGGWRMEEAPVRRSSPTSPATKH
jgi:hypothetical protein